MALQFELAGAQIDGAREYQEDAFLITNLTDAEGNPSALIIIADGMGGHAAGNVASNMAVQAFNKHVSANYPSANPADVLYECIIKANSSVKETIMETPALSGMGCTIVAAILESGKLWWVSVGDSHLYLLRDKELTKKNADHSYGGFLDRMEAQGTPVDPEPGLARNMLMSAVTGDEINEIDVSSEPFELQEGDRVILCSDGMDTLSHGKIIQFSDWSETPKDCAVALLGAVEDADMPKQDNTTVVVVDVKERAAAAAPEPEEEAAPAAKKPAPAVTAGQASAQAAPAETGEGGGKGKTGLIIGVAAVILLGIAAGVFLMQGGGKSRPTAPPPPPATPAEQAQTPAPAKVETPAPAAAPKKPQPAPPPATEETTKPQTKPAPATAKPVEFHDNLRNGTRGPTMVWIPAGSFEMGSPASSGDAEGRPRHKVTLKRFAMSKYEITFAQYDRFARATGRSRPDSEHLRRSDHPVFNVRWKDAVNYAKWLSRETGKHYRLPSEAEWEYAAGAGKESTYWWGYDPKPGMAYCFSCSDGLNPRKPTKIGSFAPNPFGIYDTAGNVAEWVEDCWHKDYNGAPTDGSVWKGGDCSYRDVRGGAYSSPPSSIRHAQRDKYAPDTRYDFIGIRVVRDP
jgi:formylglycine-generating enzyme required for sulfatase activity/serine/threonine protein phosphatase PrpC